jgi:hypothetical protein
MQRGVEQIHRSEEMRIAGSHPDRSTASSRQQSEKLAAIGSTRPSSPWPTSSLASWTSVLPVARQSPTDLVKEAFFVGRTVFGTSSIYKHYPTIYMGTKFIDI